MKKIRKSIRKHPDSYSILRPMYKIYCDVVGSSHVLPDFLIIGAARSGTTSLYEYLSQSPNVIAPTGKEIYFFDKNFQRGINWYKKFFPTKKEVANISKNLKKHVMTGEATPRYIHHPHTPKRVFDLVPHVKLIVLLRNPIDRAYSHYQMQFEHKAESLSFEEAIEQEELLKEEMEKMEQSDNYYSVEFYKRSYLTRGIYAEQLERWFKYFPREQFLIIKSEDFYSEISSVFKKVLNFLNLPNFEPEVFRPFKSRQYQSMKPETREKLVEFFKPHNERLYKLLGIDFGWDK